MPNTIRPKQSNRWPSRAGKPAARAGNVEPTAHSVTTVVAPAACPCCGGTLRKNGENVSETLELVPRQWKVIQHVREKFSCRSCDHPAAGAPSHPIARGRAGAGLLAHVLFAKYGLHLPLNRQSAAYVREGIDLDVSTLADWAHPQ